MAAPAPPTDALEQARAARRAFDPEQAVALLSAASAPLPVAALVLLGRCHTDLRRHDAAIAAFDRAIAQEPDHADAHAGRGLARLRAGQTAEALADGLRATALAPADPAKWTAFGRIASAAGVPDLAIRAFRRAAALAPDRPAIRGRLLEEQLCVCDWTDLDTLIAAVTEAIDAGHAAINPFYWHALSSSSASLQRAARLASAAQPFEPMPAHPRDRHAKLRIGYVSGELSISANALCMAGVFAAHDRTALDVFAFDNGRDDGSPLRRRIAASFTELLPVATLGDRDLATAVADRGIDVLVNLNGFFGNERSAMFRLKPAPVQVNYLGCPATMGAPYMDYIVADRVVLPPEDAHLYDEQVAWLPHSYYPTDRARPISNRVFTRAECGLPDDGFVFCCFNVSYKILPATFARWMRILAAVPGSVLWLIDAHPQATANLRRHAAAHGVDPARLVFAPRAAPPDHLARHRLADLFLDTLPYNAHTTGIDALWSGLPLLTCPGATFPSRVAASQLTAIGLPELIVADAADHERRAVELATDPVALAAIRAKLAANRLTTPLFDTAAYTRHLETAYRTMAERHRAGLPPASFWVQADS